MYMQLEDEFGDIVGKARRGQEIEPADLAREAGITEEELGKIERYELTPDPQTVARLAEELGLHPGKLQGSASKSYFPLYPAGRPGEGLVVEMMVLGTDFLVNGYVVGCQETGKGAVIDPGVDAEKILKTIEATGLEIEQVLVTHGHHDHVGVLSEICQATEAPAIINKAELGLLGGLATKVEGSLIDGEQVAIGKQMLVARGTPGHTEGSMSLVHPQAAFVGDALFAGSLGGTRNLKSYGEQRQTIGEHIMGLDERVTLFPGHGPATTVAEERAHNPFFL
ncbi:MAG: MBL fold metallo-hydrolase [Gemmatimonadetes bacterium]|jgi:hydroxyacylglutathione hydrolase|nr:MBL fold metallo-hydrolase [Gemmatimonadota bacterium]